MKVPGSFVRIQPLNQNNHPLVKRASHPGQRQLVNSSSSIIAIHLNKDSSSSFPLNPLPFLPFWLVIIDSCLLLHSQVSPSTRLKPDDLFTKSSSFVPLIDSLVLAAWHSSNRISVRITLLTQLNQPNSSKIKNACLLFAERFHASKLFGEQQQPLFPSATS